MRIAALILGILGGLAGLGGVTFVFIIGGLAASMGRVDSSQVIGLGAAGFAFSILGVVGAALAGDRPKISGSLMLLSAVGGTVAVSFAYIMAAPLLLIGGILAFFSGKSKE